MKSIVLKGEMPIPLLAFLGACVYGDPEAHYRNLDEAARDELERLVSGFGFEPWFYRYLYRILPDGKRADYQKNYQARQAAALIRERELKRLFGMLSANGLRFVPVKGADLAYRLYPEPALRYYNDWDILFHPDDCSRALEVLSENGWKAPSRYTDRHNAAMKTATHHFSPHIRGRNMLEPHFTLSNFGDVDPLEIWAYAKESPCGCGHRIFSPELNLLLLARHAASTSYFHASLPKLLTDAAMILNREKPDFAVLRAMSSCWGFPYPGDLFAAFPEFFPPETVAVFGADEEKSARFRTLFEMRAKLGERETREILLTRFQIGGSNGRVLRRILRTWGPLGMRSRYDLPKHGAWGRLSRAYLHYFFTRTKDAARTWIRHDRELHDYCRMVDSLESAGESGRMHKNV